MTNFIVGQIGIPRHSAVAKMLFNQQMLDQFVVDSYFSKKNVLTTLPIIGPLLIKNLGKYDAGFPSQLVSADWYGAIQFRQLLKKYKRIEAFKFANKRLGDRLINYAKNKKPGKYYGFDTTSSHFLEWSVNNGWESYIEQCVAPRSSQIKMWKLFEDKFDMDYSYQIEYCLFQQEVEHEEWEYANHIVVPSQYVRDELSKDKGIDMQKVRIVHYGYSPTIEKEFIIEKINKKFEKKTDDTFNVLFAGNAGYRKGLSDIIAIASQLFKENIHFKIAGALEHEAKNLIAQYPFANVEYLGKLSKEELEKQYSNSDIFFFPSYLEGSALVLVEAMSWGLPIVTTYQSGSVVEHGTNGFISEAGDVETLKNNIVKLFTNSKLRYDMSINALDASSDYSIEKYNENLLKIFKQDVSFES